MDGALDEISKLFGGDEKSKKTGGMGSKLLIVVAVLVVLFLLILVGYGMYMLYSKYSNDDPDKNTFSGRHAGAAYQYKVNPQRMMRSNGEPLDRFRGDTYDGPDLPRMNDYTIDTEIDNYQEPYFGFIGDRSCPEHADTTNEYAIPQHPILPEKPFQNCGHLNKMENLLYNI